MHTERTITVAMMWLLLAGAQNAVAAEATDVIDAIKGGAASFDVRYRFEYVDQDGIDKEADASTARLRLTLGSAPIHGFSAGVETDYVRVVGAEKYNSTRNGETQYPVVADPDGFDWNQWYLKFANDALTGTAGRQRINQGRQRFVGAVAWRQNEQTFDALRTQFALGRVTVDYAYVWNVRRVFGPEHGTPSENWDSHTHFLYTTFDVLPKGHTLVAFGYLMDFENNEGPVNSNATAGIEYSGAFGPLTLAASVAHQSDYADSPLDYDAWYGYVEAAVAVRAVKFIVGYELLGSDDGNAGFGTPLATLHKFQGWADKFLATPLTGIRDGYVGVTGNVRGVALGAFWHDFSADDGGADYGREIDLSAGYALREHLNVELKFARYDADDFATDTTKAWLTLIWQP